MEDKLNRIATQLENIVYLLVFMIQKDLHKEQAENDITYTDSLAEWINYMSKQIGM